MTDPLEPRFSRRQKTITFLVAVGAALLLCSLPGCGRSSEAKPPGRGRDLLLQRVERLEQRLDMLEAQRFDFDGDGAPAKKGVVR